MATWPFLTGSVNEFLDGALIVVAIMIIYYILKFLGMLFSGGSGDPSAFWEWLKRMFRRRDDDDEGEVPDFTSELNQIENLLNNYDADYNQFVIAGNDLLQTNYDHLTSIGGSGPPSPPVSPAQWRRVFDGISNLNLIGTQINQEIHNIATHRLFHNMSATQRTRWTNLLTRWSTNLTRTETYRNDFINRFVNGDPPA